LRGVDLSLARKVQDFFLFERDIPPIKDSINH
jgi:hypothetical protein